LAIFDRFKSAWNAFIGVTSFQDLNLDTTPGYSGYSYSGISPSRSRLKYQNERSIISSIYARMSIDVAAVSFRHIKLDSSGRYEDDIKSNLNNCLTLEANLDQAPRAFRQDIVMTMFDKGVAAIVPVDTSVNPDTNETMDIYTMRVGEITQWYPRHVRVSVYNEDKAQRQEITLEKRYVAIVENPLFSVMNEPNSTLQRLKNKLNLLDVVDDQTSSGKLDIIIQLPYAIKSESRRVQAEQRREDIEFQLKGSKYGIAYTDATEKITQLNRPAENNLLDQVEYLIKMLYGQLGLTEEVMNGTADEKIMVNYYNRTIEPIADAIQEAMQRAFIGYKGTVDNQQIRYFANPFRYIPVSVLAEVADKFTRNEILTGNEFRGFIGIKPSIDPKADMLRNSNLPIADTGPPAPPTTSSTNGKTVASV
jgi:Phage portal protein